ncbi:MAG TPA: NAD(P)-binding protein [Polyangiaceae bacterium]|nr:NAD(P)-binding protein [Polyangiaceae bacterium]
MTETRTSPIKVAVLGGGAASLTTAFELTSPEHSGKYEVTVYQMGFRLGGKGASGRNAAEHDRIEEHGLHLWMGFYDNAFRLMQKAYGELGRTSGPLKTWRDAFKQHDDVVLMEPVAGKNMQWTLRFPQNGLTPGEGEEPALWELTRAILHLMHDIWLGSPCRTLGAGQPTPAVPAEVDASVRGAAVRGYAPRPLRSGGLLARLRGAILPGVEALEHPVGALIASAHSIASSIPHDQKPGDAETRALVWLIQKAMELLYRFIGDQAAVNFDARRLWVSVNLCGAAACGILQDGLLDQGYAAIEHLDLRQWLQQNGANAMTLASSPIRTVYDLVFGFAGGDVGKPSLAAGTGLRGGMRLLFDYKGSIFYKMQAGMGDTVFTPLYQVLARRGVKFRFFHRVDALRVNPSTKLVDAIDIKEQVLLKRDEYEPLVDVGGLPCWPSAPLYDQIRSGDALARSGINLESAWSPPFEDERPKRLERGRDFDHVVLGISLGAFPYIARELAENSAAFAAMVENVKTVQTCACQLWFGPSLRELGFSNPELGDEAPLVGGLTEPLDTWADMSQLLPRESWPADGPRNVAYLCGPLDEPTPVPPFSDHDFPARELARLDGIIVPFLDKQMAALWPKVIGAGGFDWNALVGTGSGPARLRSQYRRVNIDPSERYVLSVPGSSRFRLSADGSGFANVFLAGDWTKCGLDAGCVEAAVTSGMLAARALVART